MVGHRSALVPNSPDTAGKFTEPMPKAWGIDYVLSRPDDLPQFAEHYEKCQAAGKPGVALVAEGRCNYWDLG